MAEASGVVWIPLSMRQYRLHWSTLTPAGEMPGLSSLVLVPKLPHRTTPLHRFAHWPEVWSSKAWILYSLDWTALIQGEQQGCQGRLFGLVWTHLGLSILECDRFVWLCCWMFRRHCIVLSVSVEKNDTLVGRPCTDTVSAGQRRESDWHVENNVFLSWIQYGTLI